MFYLIFSYVPHSVGSAVAAVDQAVSGQQAVNVPQIPLQNIFENIATLITNFNSSAWNSDIQSLLYIIKFVGTYVSLLFIIGLAFVIVKLKEFNRQQRVKEEHEEAEAVAAALVPGGAWSSIVVDGISLGTAVKASVSSEMPMAVSGVVSDKTDHAHASLASKIMSGIMNGGSVGDLRAASSVANPPAPMSIAEAQKIVHANKWQRILDHVSSDNPNDWRQAILEADILLDDMLSLMGGHGTTLGEKLKAMTTTEMPSLQLAWEAHLVRNQIAHEGADFSVSQREARRVISLYEHVLRQGMYF